jgi:predicted extracellular nuclease
MHQLPKFALALIILATTAGVVEADTTPQSLPFSQDWTNAALITVNNDWSGVPGIVGYRGDSLTGSTGTNPQTIVADGSSTPLNVTANLANPSGSTAGGLAEAAITNPVVALQGSGTADAPHMVLALDLTGESGVTISYLVRDVDGSADNAIQPLALQYRIGGTGDYTDIPAAYVADATDGPSTATLETPVCTPLPGAVDGQALVELRWITANAAGNDEWVGVDDIQVGTSITCPPRLSVGDVDVVEGDSGTVTATFVVELSAAAPVGGISFDITTADDNPVSATAGVDYVTNSATGATIAEGQTEYEFSVTVNGDGDIEPNETFLVQISNATGGGVVVDDDEAVGTILNDDALPVEIEVIQGAGLASPIAGQVARTNDNIVTALAGDGFFIQTPDDRRDLDPETSAGIFVFTGFPFVGTPIAVGDQVDVVGIVQEFFGLTEINAFSVSFDAGGLPLPDPVTLDATVPSPTPPVAATELERFENMLVEIVGGAVGAGNQFFGSDPLAELWITAGPRAFREPGIEYPGEVGLPVFDGNPEVFELDQDRLGLAASPVLGGSTFDAVGILGYEFGGYEVWATSFAVTSPNPAAAVPEAAEDEVTIGSLNLFRLFDDVDDPGTQDDGAVIPTAEYQRRLEKFSRYIREKLRSPDVLAVQEVEHLAALQALAARILADDPTVSYTAYLEEGNDVGGIDVGFLVRSSTVSVVATTQLEADTIFSFPGEPDTFLHDRPPFLLEATFTDQTGEESPFAVLVVHQRSLSGIDGNEGDRIRQKRLEQAQSVAQIAQDLQTEPAAAPLVVVGDFNAYEFTDGYVDVIGQIRGEVNPADNMLSGPDLVNPNLTNQVMSLPADERYSFIFGGSAQVLDHALTTELMTARVRWFAYGRGNTDAAANLINDAATPLRSSDHDGFVMAFVGSAIFADGFESGNTSAWSATVP